MIAGRRGRLTGSVPVQPGERGFEPALDATVGAAVRRAAESPGSPIRVRSDDLHRKLRCRPQRNLIVFAVDASESMGEGSTIRMRAAKGAVLALLDTAYRNRDRVALVVFHGERAAVPLPPTESIELARERLQYLPTGGATPFADGLLQARKLISRERLRDPQLAPLLVVISDGEANIALQKGADVRKELLALAGELRKEAVRALVLDTRSEGAGPSRELNELATALDGTYRHVDDLRTAAVVDMVRNADKLGPDPQ